MSLLFLAHRAPFAPDRGDRIRSYHVLRHLARAMPVHLVTFAGDPAEPVPALPLASVTVIPRVKTRARAAIEALASGRAVSIAAFADARIGAAVAEVMRRHRPEQAYVFSGQMAQHVPADLPFVMDFCDVDSAKFAAMRGWIYAREARLLAAEERRIADRATATVFVSAAEAALFGDHRSVSVVENGVDTAFWDPARVEARGSASIVFTGQMDYAPNVDAVAWFAGEVLPLIRMRHPAASFAIVGRAPTAAVRALARLPGVVVTGAVDDVRGYLAGAAAVVAPLMLARGVQNKVLEAMAMARPVVASVAAAEGIDHAGTLVTAGDAAGFAAEVIALLDDRAGGDRRGAAARAQVMRRYGWDAALAPLDRLVGIGERCAA